MKILKKLKSVFCRRHNPEIIQEIFRKTAAESMFCTTFNEALLSVVDNSPFYLLHLRCLPGISTGKILSIMASYGFTQKEFRRFVQVFYPERTNLLTVEGSYRWLITPSDIAETIAEKVIRKEFFLYLANNVRYDDI